MTKYKRSDIIGRMSGARGEVVASSGDDADAFVPAVIVVYFITCSLHASCMRTCRPVVRCTWTTWLLLVVSTLRAYRELIHDGWFMDEQIYLSTPLLLSQEATYRLVVALSIAKANALRFLTSHGLHGSVKIKFTTVYSAFARDIF